ncbi:MAG: hypothetical protein ACFCUQ_04600 [Kiloniellales bacterium]
MTITPAPAGADDLPAMTNPAERARLQVLLTDLAGGTLAKSAAFAPPGAATRAQAAVAEFPALYARRPLRDNSGGSGFNDSLWLFALARAFAPSLIVESGTHRGHSAWLFRQACPQAEIHSFDIAPERLSHREPDITYHACDWSDVALSARDPAASLIFFDDHVSHARRLREAHARGFRLLLLDDNFPAHALYATGGPPLPTLAMITDPALATGGRLAWTRKGKAYSYNFDAAAVADVRALVADCLVLPELAPLTHYPLGSCLTLVRLAD